MQETGNKPAGEYPPIHAVIIDDEPKIALSLQQLIGQYCPEVVVTGIANSIETGLQLIRETTPNLVFLDISFPEGNGFDLLDRLGSHDFELIFTTAHQEFGARAFQYEALHYLLKPYFIEELEEAVQRYKNKHPAPLKRPSDRIALSSAKALTFVEISHIIRLQSDNNYTEVFLNNQPSIVVSKHLGHFEKLLSGHPFFRSHQSHLINLRYVRKYHKGKGGIIEMEDGSTVELSPRNKDRFLEKMASGTSFSG